MGLEMRRAANVLRTRSSGLLLHITCLPSNFGIGDMGPEAYHFVDFLSDSGMRYWQILPLTAMKCGGEYSPYDCISAFAGNKYLISPVMMQSAGYLSVQDLRSIPHFAKSRVDYVTAIRFKDRLFEKAYSFFDRTGTGRRNYLRFCRRSRSWLDDFALFIVLQRRSGGKSWVEWPVHWRKRNKTTLASLREAYKDDIEREKFLQFVFAEQWHALKAYSARRKIRIIGDMPIYVDFDSADVWSHPRIFKLGKDMKHRFVSGVPPDYFSDTGQLWGNPVYDWDVMRRTGYRWWVDRVAHNLSLFDCIRLDHFRGLVAYWQVSSHAKTAKNGKWVKAPAADFLKTLYRKFPVLPLIAEDLGTITPDVRQIIRQFGLPGMKVLLFAFGNGSAANPYLLHNHIKNCVVYTGTHDNNTVRGWFENEASLKEKQRLYSYLGRKVSAQHVHEEFLRLAMMSVANTAIIPMQDILGLGSIAHMNRPATIKGNWRWRLATDYSESVSVARLRSMNEIYGRA